MDSSSSSGQGDAGNVLKMKIFDLVHIDVHVFGLIAEPSKRFLEDGVLAGNTFLHR